MFLVTVVYTGRLDPGNINQIVLAGMGCVVGIVGIILGFGFGFGLGGINGIRFLPRESISKKFLKMRIIPIDK